MTNSKTYFSYDELDKENDFVRYSALRICESVVNEEINGRKKRISFKISEKEDVITHQKTLVVSFKYFGKELRYEQIGNIERLIDLHAADTLDFNPFFNLKFENMLLDYGETEGEEYYVYNVHFNHVVV